ncbi:MAG: DUF4965 domain-containing protein [Phycisphaerae bacterium]|nr:DUF4965 domain-containing protein [Phycisphaerae bacterium]
MVNRRSPISLTLAIAIAMGVLPALARGDWKPAEGPLMTQWAKDVSPEKVHPEYPRPQMVRRNWLNLNGLWDYAIRPKDVAKPESFDGQILVPFPAESALSGVMKPVGPDNRLWYRRTFTVPEKWNSAADKKRILLHFGAVDWDCAVWVNGKEVGNHKGGYDPFTLDVTDVLKRGGDQEIILSVWDPTNTGTQPHGKQVLKPGGIMYTAVTGIWQTVWIEATPRAYIESLDMVPDIDAQVLRVKVHVQGDIPDPSKYRITLLPTAPSPTGEFRSSLIKPSGGAIGEQLEVSLRNPNLWSPSTPYLYDLSVNLMQDGQIVDSVYTYFAMRKISLGKDENGVLRLCLNNKPLFQYGPLDQGWWPDGLYTAPTDEALKYDIEVTKKLGMNMARKHVKVEPDRWYYWCDKLGLLVWQDMPSGDKGIGGKDPDLTRTEESAKQYDAELTRIIEAFRNHPSIVMWVPFNEGWGQFDTPRVVDMIRKLDPSRLVDNASGWTDRGVGDVMDVHSYPGPAVPRIEEKRAGVLGEFGGLGLPLSGHTWQQDKNWGYRSFTTRDDLTDAYLGLIRKLHAMTGDQGLSAAVYTQTTDVEVEVNGLMTYDREIVKMDVNSVAAANRTLYTPPQPRKAGDKLIPPATPLVACDPYFSIWSPADKLTDEDTVHWTGKPNRLTSLVRIDGKPYRIMGASPARVPALEQTSLTVLPTRTIYTFEGAGVALQLTFLTAALPQDIDILSRPVTYLTYSVRATDGKKHEVQVYFDAAADLVVNEPRQQVVWEASTLMAQRPGNVGLADAMTFALLKMGSKDQPVLAKRGDDIRIDWGYLYTAADQAGVSDYTVAAGAVARADFADKGKLPETDPCQPRAAGDQTPVSAMTLDFGEVGKQATSRWLMLAYDDLYSIQYMQKNLRPYWRRTGWEAPDLLIAAANDYASLQKRCAAFDNELMADLTKAGGAKYAKLAALAYRQCFAAGKFVADENGQPLQFCKENHSNGCIGTSDVFYPMAPQFLLFGPSLAKSFLVPFMNYAASDRWKFPFAPHDLGQYPHANGQRYGGGERTQENQMPVEESGNLLLLMGAIAQMEGNANFAGLYWPQLEKWAEYLKAKGFDPENQLCTDDFAGHLAHNVNLSVKAICGLGAFAKLCDMRGDKAKAEEYSTLAKEFAARWVKEAADGPSVAGILPANRGRDALDTDTKERGQDALATDHFRLAFDKSGTWSQKYNLVWDRILGLNLFPAEVARKEMDFYKKTQNKYGLPLDNRSLYTKLDWVLWTATLTQKRADFEALVDPVYLFLNETPDRSPMTDWYFTNDARKRGFTARPVVGGVFLQMLYNKSVWHKYAGRDQTKAANWAPMPKPPVTVAVVSTASEKAAAWSYTTRRPGRGWFRADFDASGWKQGESGFGTKGTPGATIGTEWNTADIWLRRTFTLEGTNLGDLQLSVHHDEDAEVYLNGVLAASATSFTTQYEPLPINADARAALKQGENLIAVHCHQTGGGQYIDAGLVQVVEQKK